MTYELKKVEVVSEDGKKKYYYYNLLVCNFVNSKMEEVDIELYLPLDWQYKKFEKNGKKYCNLNRLDKIYYQQEVSKKIK